MSTVYFGPPAKASVAEIDAGTNDAKFLTPLGLAGSAVGLLALSSLQVLDVQQFDASDDWDKPAGAVLVLVVLIGGGGGGGSGRNDTTGTRYGGEGGNPGGTIFNLIQASELSSTEAVVVGAGGAGAAAKTNVGDGNNGGHGAETTFAGFAAGGGRQGRGGSATGPTTTPFTAPLINGGTSFYWVQQYLGAADMLIPNPHAGHCGVGARGNGTAQFSIQGGAGLAGAGGFTDTPGDDGVGSTAGIAGGSGGGGGYAAGDAGGDGGTPGGGGGGGAQGDDSSNGGQSGPGGDGGDGRALIVTFG